MNDTQKLQIPVWLKAILAILIVLVGVQGFFLYRLSSDDTLTNAVNKKIEVVAQGDSSAPASQRDPANPLSPLGFDPFQSDPFFQGRSWDPFQEMQRMRERMDQLFGDALNRFDSSDRFSDLFDTDFPTRPRIDVHETDKAYEITVDMPGAEASTIETALQDQTLRISASVDQQSEESSEGESAGSILRRERWVSRFERFIPLPTPVDKAGMNTEFKDGVLHIRIPKTT